MSTITRADKHDRVQTYSLTWVVDHDEEPDEIDRAILADYAPLNALRREELQVRRELLEGALYSYSMIPRQGMIRRWLAEIDAELEGSDA